MNREKTLTSLLLDYRYSILLGFLALTVVDLCQLSIPLIIEKVIDSLVADSGSGISTYALYIVGIALVMSVFRFFWRYFLLGASRKIELALRDSFFKHLQTLPFNFFSERKTGDLMAHTVNDIEAIKMACGIGVIIAYDGLLLLVFILAAMIYVSPALALWAFIPFPVLCFLIIKFGRAIEERFAGVQSAFSALTESARASIAGIKVVKAAVAESAEIRDFDRASNEYMRSNLNLIRIWGVYQPLISFIAGTGVVIFLWAGGRSAVTGGITLGDFVAILIYIGMLAWPMTAMAWAVDMIKRGNASLERINNILRTKPEEAPIDGGINIARGGGGGIELRNVNFSYNGSKVLRGVNLSIPQGKSFAIVGGTGSGKSALLRLLVKIEHLPDESSILIGGYDVRAISKQSLGRAVVFIPQETTVFSGTVRDNISFMNPRLQDSDIERAAKAAQIYDDIMGFPGGFDARVGERGLSLSGGQRQRIAIARAILLEPDALVLDDALSSLDVRTENLLLGELKKLMRAGTLVAVSSRVPSISGFDRIAVLDRGIIAESGRHEELMARDGLYAKLYRVQTLDDDPLPEKPH
ncbi:MAG: ABC transporter ATP-binding protein [Deltaproteobacteria bacterium]